jgi:hypothetical protein
MTEAEMKKMFGSLCLAAIAVLSLSSAAFSLPNVHWDFSLETTGSDFHWTSPTAIDNGAAFDYAYTVGKIEAKLTYYLGSFPITFWYDVTNYVVPDQKAGTGTQPGPLPLEMPLRPINYPDVPPYSFAANLYLYAGADGYGHVDLTDVQMGDIDYENMRLTLSGLRLSGSIDITSNQQAPITETPTPTPTAPPEPTGEASPTPTPTSSPEPTGEVTPTPTTPEPAATPTPEPTPILPAEGQFKLTTSVPGGHGKIVTSAQTYFNPGAVVILQAVPDDGYEVRAWSGTDSDSSTSATNTVTMDSDKTVSVEFAPIGTVPAPSENSPNNSGGGCGFSGASLILLIGLMFLGLRRQ